MQLAHLFTPVAICLLVNLTAAQGKDGVGQSSVQAADEFDFGWGRNRNDGRFNNNRIDFEDSLSDYIDDRNDYDDDHCPFFCRQSLRRTLFCRWEIPRCRYSGRNWGRNNRRNSDRHRHSHRRCPFECRRAMRVSRQCQAIYDKCEEFNVFDYDFD